MNAKKILLTGLCCAGFLWMFCYQQELTAAQEEMAKPVKIATVNLRDIFQGCKKNADYQTRVVEEENKILAGLKKLNDEAEAAKAALKTRKVGTKDFWSLQEELIVKQSELTAKKEFYQQQVGFRDQQWTEKLYELILKCVGEIAEQNGIDIVLVKEDVELPAATGTELMLLIRTHKLLYASDKIDVTKEVLALVDKSPD